MPAPFSILALDLHNTIYDEVLEYGLAIDEAVAFWINMASERVADITHEMLYKELANAHRRLGSDWDSEVWQQLPTLARLGLSEAEFTKAADEAEKRRRRKSQQLTLAGLYEGIPETLRALKQRGVRIFIITEAAADAAMRAVKWLKLSGIVDGVYSYPSSISPAADKHTYHRPFPGLEKRQYLKKPHPYLLAALLLDEAIHSGNIPPSTELQQVFAVNHDDTFLIRDLPDTSPVQSDAGARLTLLETPYANALRQTMAAVLYVGDSKFKDGLLARNAGVAFGYAGYGKKVKDTDSDNHRKSLAIMYAVTGWDPEVMALTQEASKSQTVNDLKPDYTFENSLSEALNLFGA